MPKGGLSYESRAACIADAKRKGMSAAPCRNVPVTQGDQTEMPMNTPGVIPPGQPRMQGQRPSPMQGQGQPRMQGYGAGPRRNSAPYPNPRRKRRGPSGY